MSDSKGYAFNYSSKELITSKLKINAKENGNKEWSFLGILKLCKIGKRNRPLGKVPRNVRSQKKTIEQERRKNYQRIKE